MKYVAQRGPVDCGVAALAMATGLPYETCAHPFEHRLARPLGQRGGLNEDLITEFLWSSGFAWQRIYRTSNFFADNRQREVWPIEPWAPVHLLMVHATRDWHFCVMDEAGLIFDPWDATRNEKRLADLMPAPYSQVGWMMGIWRVRDNGEA